MKKLLFLLLFTWCSSILVQAQTTSIYIVRHGEKDTKDPADGDPELSTEGKERAVSLAERLKDSNIAAVFSTDYKRTRETAQPLAELKQLKIEVYDPGKPAQLAERIRSGYAGKTILIVGHSNTVLGLTEAFGATRPLKVLSDDDYDNLLMVTIDNGTVKATSEKFGKPHHAGN